MKKIITILTILILISCSSDKGNEDSKTILNPPKNLIGSVISSTQINLSWTDNSTNETGFNIERKKGNENYVIVGTVDSNISIFSNTELIQNTTYTYRISSFNAVEKSSTYSNEISLTTNTQVELPNLETKNISLISAATASSGGVIYSDGSSEITTKGIVWSTNLNPTVDLLTKTSDGIGLDNFTSSIAGLSANTTYYVRAYATNNEGTAYGNQISFTTSPPISTITDIDGNVYELITICNQTWTKTNLNVSKYRNGDIIPQVDDYKEWGSLTTGAWCYYANSSSNGITYGKLYNWYAVNDPRGLAPVGFHIPTETEWDTMLLCLGDTDVAGGKMKETGTIHWNSPNIDATNSSGFTGIPGGSINPLNGFYTIGNQATWWSTTSASAYPDYAFTCGLQFNFEFAIRNIEPKNYGLSVRCIKD
jgi:uncharacterized protein (TIGR02145 family)